MALHNPQKQIEQVRRPKPTDAAQVTCSPKRTGFSVYLLVHSESNRTYIGSTNNLNRRIRQHNGEIRGGARYTTSFRGTGKWMYLFQLNCLTKSEALSLEKQAKSQCSTLNCSNFSARVRAKIGILTSLCDQYPSRVQKTTFALNWE